MLLADRNRPPVARLKRVATTSRAGEPGPSRGRKQNRPPVRENTSRRAWTTRSWRLNRARVPPDHASSGMPAKAAIRPPRPLPAA